MMNSEIWKDLIIKNNSKIVFLIMDGLGGLPMPGGDKTELETAKTPNLDRYVKEGIAGLLDPIYPGFTPGSGPAHLALFGYEPVEYNIGRGVLSALGVDFELTGRDVAARLNFCTIDKEGKVTDRRAGRISTEVNQKLCEKIKNKVKLSGGMEYFLSDKGWFTSIRKIDPSKVRRFWPLLSGSPAEPPSPSAIYRYPSSPKASCPPLWLLNGCGICKIISPVLESEFCRSVEYLAITVRRGSAAV